MAKYTVAHSCGHEETHQLFGPQRGRDSKIAWLQRRPCEGCRAEARAKANAEQSKRDGEAAHAAGLPVLRGSERQCAWAETIRREKLAFLRDDAASLAGRPELAPLAAYTAALVESPLDPANWAAFRDAATDAGVSQQAGLPFADEVVAVVRLLREADAKWWIDNRGPAGRVLVRQLAEESARAAEAKAEQEKKAEAARKNWEAMDEVARKIHGFVNHSQRKTYSALQTGKYNRKPERLAGFDSEGEAAAAYAAAGLDPEARLIEAEWKDRFASEVKVWSGGDGEKRVFVGHGYNRNCLTYYHTGNGRHRPGSLEIGPRAEAAVGDRLEELKAYLAKLCGEWETLSVRIAEDGSAGEG